MIDDLIGHIGYGNFIIVLFVLILVHELGHYLAARFCGIRVEVFSVGFGREILGFTDKSGTRWRLSLIPFGGYVKMFGEMQPGFAHEGDIPVAQEKYAFHTQSLPKRMLVVAAGPFANFLYAIILFAIIFYTVGEQRSVPFSEGGIGGVQENSQAMTAGLQTGDIIFNVNGRPIDSFNDLIEVVSTSNGAELAIKYYRGGRENLAYLQPEKILTAGEDGKTHTQYRIGVHNSRPLFTPLPPLQALMAGVKATWNDSILTLSSIGEIIGGNRSVDELGGPVKIVQLSNDFAQMGLFSFVFFTIILSINLGLLNLLPIPVLDGGHLLFYMIEAIIRRPLSPKAQDISMRIGLSTLIVFMVFITFNDIQNIIGF